MKVFNDGTRKKILCHKVLSEIHIGYIFHSHHMYMWPNKLRFRAALRFTFSFHSKNIHPRSNSNSLSREEVKFRISCHSLSSNHI